MRKALLAIVAASVMMLVPASPALANDTRCMGFLTGTFDNVVVPEGQFCFLFNSEVRGNAKSLEDATFFSVNNDIRGNLDADKSRRVFFQGNTTAGGTTPGNRGTVGGDVHVKDLRGDPASSFNIGVCNLNVGGDLIVENANDARVEIGSKLANCIQGNDVEGNVQVFKNRLSPNPVSGFFDDLSVFNNDVGGEVQIFENVSPTTNNLQTVENNRVPEGNMQVFKNQGRAPKRVVGNSVGQNLQCKENDQPFLGQPNVVGGNAEDQCGRP